MLSVAHWGHETKHKLLKKMLHIGDNVAHWGVAHWVHSVYFEKKKIFSQIFIQNSLDTWSRCKTILEIDGAIVFISEPYNWEHPDIDATIFNVEIGDNNDLVQGQIRNVNIVCYE